MPDDIRRISGNSLAAHLDFFRDNPPNDFSIIHNGASQDGALQFTIGKYVSGKNNFSVLIRVKTAGKTRLVHDISFVKE